MKTIVMALLLTGLTLADAVTGSYVGEFVAAVADYAKKPMLYNKINLSVDSIQGDVVKGHSVVAGNSRPFVGTAVRKGNLLEITAKEPGDDQYDGVFQFTLDPAAKTVSGRWVANDKNLAVSTRKFTLSKRTFRYDPTQPLGRLWSRQVYDSYDRVSDTAERITNDAIRFNASTTRLRPQDVENMYRRDLEVMRNTIYARHGYSFKNREMRFLFDRIDWYMPVSTDVTAQLTDLEKDNIDLLKRYENHATTYYDHFGR
ncbi:MAG: YARHG domain-containing protein [Candidatus Eremiobacteraeota bacterium]|nr:YARHG domain-containing protein [Candidatus Eremiobacteraeota bacterium]MCW5867109.1 YARHG domain-containing protein [Candidatus Eremiobacteraeota bacterium]